MLHGLKADHMQLFKQLLVSLILHGLKLSPRKCQLLMKHLIYLGNVFHIENGVITITPMKSMIEAIQKLLPPTTVKECKSFCGVVNYLSLFCKDLQKTLKPIYELPRKEVPFYWTEFHQKAFEQVKELLIKVKEATKQLGHGDDAVINLLKATMPTELYGTLLWPQ